MELRRRLADLRPRPTRRTSTPRRGRFTAVADGVRLVRARRPRRARSSPRATPRRRSRSTAPLDGGLFSFGDKLQYKVTVTDPEDPTINCNDVTVTFVLGHDTHGHAEQTGTGCTGFLQTDADDVVARRQRVRRHQRAATPTRAPTGGAPSLTTAGQNQIRQKRQEVEFVVNQSGTTTATNTDGGARACTAAASPAGDWMQLNGPFNLFQIDTVAVPLRGRRPPAAPSGSPLAAIDLRQDSITGPIVATANLTSTGGTAAWATRRSRSPTAAGKHELFLVVPHGHGRRDGRQPVQPQLGWSSTATASRSRDQHAGQRRRHRAGDAGAVARHAGGVRGRSPRASPRRTRASTTANVISTAGDATLSVADPSATRPATSSTARSRCPRRSGQGGQRGRHRRRVRDVGGSATPTTRAHLRRPGVQRRRHRHVPAGDRRQRRPPHGRYGKTLTFTLSTTTP